MGDNQIEDDDLISQDDIDALLQSSQADNLDDAIDDEDDEDISMLISQEDINEVLSSQRPEADDPPETVAKNDDVIDASKAVAVQDCLMTQTSLDALIEAQVSQQTEPASKDPEPEESPESEAVELDFDMDQIESELDLTADPDPLINIDLSDDQPLVEPDLSEDMDEGLVSQEDIDDLLSETDDEPDKDAKDEANVLLDESGDEKILGDDDILISQDDIDALLTASDQEDEDILGDLLESASESDFDEDDADDDGDDEADPDQVVLEGIDSPDNDEKASEPKKGKTRYRSKRLLACIAGGVFLMVLLPVSYFLFVPSAPQEERTFQLAVQQENKSQEVPVESVDINLAEKSSSRIPGTLVLKDFLILAPEESKTLTYIAVDIAIDYSDKNAYVEINDNLPFYRELIYESIQKSLNSERHEDITEPDLVEGVELALKKVFPDNYINKIRFDAFKAG